ncbi:MAG TPA: NAD(P)H-hydrate dehydratase [Longimicrobiaceae bacterium]|nr:NAD(P)H-hydrate dehydratase [Longimicrobiaceae bacterium]
MPDRPSPASDPPACYGAGRVPVLTAEEMREWDRRAVEELGVPQPVLMEAAGRAAAAVVQRLYPRGRVACAVGSGNNGGDALVLARTLRAGGREVAVVAVGSRAPDAALLHGWEVETIPADGAAAAFRAAEVIVDGLLGTGASGPPRDACARAIEAINGAGKKVVALDGPSGVDFTTGAAAGAAVRADVTVTFGAPKRGLLLFPGRRLCGRIVAVEIGFAPFDPDCGAQLLTPAWAQARLPAVPPDAHKGQRGRVVVVAGRRGMAGAAVLAGMGALRAGAGMAVLVGPEANRGILQAALPEALFADRDALDDGVLRAADAVVAGPGMGTDDESLALLRRVAAAAECPLLFDADAITLLARDPSLRDAVAGPLLLTPHPGEMSRLLGVKTEEIRRDPFAAAAQAAERYCCAVLLKGAPSLVAGAGEPTLVNVTGHAGIATGGMGDVLGGMIGAFLAVAIAPRTAAGLGLYYSGRAAQLAGRGRGLLPRDVVEALPAAMLEEAPAESDLGVPGVILDLPPAY